MRARPWVVTCVLTLLVAAPARAQSHSGHGLGSGHCLPGGFPIPAAVGGGWGGWGFWMPVLPPPIVVISPGGPFPAAGPALPPPIVAQGLGAVPALFPHVAPPPPGLKPEKPKPEPQKLGDPARSKQLITLGDRVFRHGNVHRAAERYEQALQADPGAAAPRVRLAQVALVRGKYAEAANRYREAQAAQPEWLVHAPDIQAIYGDPGDFAAPIARLETHLQVEPNDRDAWLVLGAQYFLSGRTRRAADVFERLTDRQADPTLTAFLDATRPPVAARH